MANNVLGPAFMARLPPVEKFVLVAMADRADESGYLFVSLRYLILKTGLSERTIRRALGSLESAGFLRRSFVPQRATDYYLDLSVLAARKDPDWPNPAKREGLHPVAVGSATPRHSGPTPSGGVAPPPGGVAPPPGGVAPPPAVWPPYPILILLRIP